MKHTNNLMLMIATFLYGERSAAQFSFDFPAALAESYEELQKENATLCEYFEEEMPELCASFDPHNTGDADTLDEQQFRLRVLTVYQEALAMSMQPAS